MYFGIKEMQFDYMLPSSIPPAEIGAHLAQFDHAGMVERLAAQGFGLVELGGDLALFFAQAFAPPAIDRLVALKARLKLRYTVHLPLWSVEPSTPLGPVRRASVRALADIVQATGPLQPEVYVLHAFGALASEFYRRRLPAGTHAVLLQQFQNGALESCQALLGETGLVSRRLAVETIEFPLERILALAESLDLSVCFDTGHVLSGFSGDVEFFAALDRCLPRLAEVHLHDAARNTNQERIVYGRDHQPLGTGDLELVRFLDRLDAGGFDGPVILELSVPQAVRSMNVIRALRPGAAA